MTDRELIEYAAKAAGWTWWQSKHGYWNVKDPNGKEQSCCVGWAKFDPNTGEALPEPTLADAVEEFGWYPLISDGDALRLAVKLGLDVCIDTPHEDEPHTHVIGFFDDSTATTIDAIEKHGDPYAATRRAIVRAAAEIGKEMK